MSFITCVAIADDQVSVEIHMIDQNSRQELSRPVIVTKIWHYINVTLDSDNFQQLTLEFYKGSSKPNSCLLYTSDAADELDGVDLGGRRIIKKNFFNDTATTEIYTV